MIEQLTNRLQNEYKFLNDYMRNMSGHKLLIIGAGCSKNFKQSVSQIPGLECPTDNDFFRMAKKVLLSGNVEPNFLLTIQNMILTLQGLYGYDFSFDQESFMKGWINTEKGRKTLDFLDDKRLSLEKVMTQLSLQTEVFQPMPSLYGYPRKDSSNFYVDDSLPALLELVAITIEEALRGQICQEHLKLADSLEQGDTVISFNYDLLMDNALRQSGKLTDSGYFLPFNKVYSEQSWESPESKWSQVTMLKLHGSLNWLHCSYCNSYLLTRSEKMGAWNAIKPKTCPTCNQSNIYLERVIVPPLLAKDYSIHPLKYLWNRAITQVAVSREIVIIGYSFPSTDFGTEAILRLGLSGTLQKRVHFTIVNPDETVYSRFKDAFNSSPVTWKKSLAEYLETIE
jgi:NAD-dependent SIR2 family protein deacetylase